jgi:hypothetical protein
MNSIKKFWNSGLTGKIVIAGVGLFVFCCLCSIPIAIMNPSTPTSASTDVASNQIATQAEQSAVEQPTQAPQLTNTPEPTQTSLPPTATEDPNIIRVGTHLVGTDIQPGIYRGFAGDDLFTSCYWARLKDLSGSLDALLANDNSIGQYYIEVRPTDQALQTDCELIPLASVPAPTEIPQVIPPGMYLVGRDIQPGTYRGEAGADISDSCYWARLSDVAGELDGVLANDNATGQFYVQVAASDFALSTGCQLERVGD